MSEYIIPTENLIAFRRGQPRQDTEPIARMSFASIKGQDVGLSVRDFAAIALAALVLAVIGLMYLVQASDIASISYRVHEVRNEIMRLEQENSVLAVEIARMEGLERVELRARELGFSQPSQMLYVQADAPAAPEPVALAGE